MTQETYSTIVKAIIDHYGPGQQMIVAIEELSELQKELTKVLRDNGNINHIIEEIADAELMIEQLKIIFEISPDVIQRSREKKVIRTLDHIIDEQYREGQIHDDIQGAFPSEAN